MFSSPNSVRYWPKAFSIAPKAVPMDEISRQHSQLNRTLLRLQFANQGLKCHELLVQDTSPRWGRRLK
jgi:hypothetical protein